MSPIWRVRGVEDLRNTATLCNGLIMSVDLTTGIVFDSYIEVPDFDGDDLDEPEGKIEGHGAVIAGHKLFVFGGDYSWGNDVALYVCDLNEMEWLCEGLEDQGPNFGEVLKCFVHNDTIHAWTWKENVSRMYTLDLIMMNEWRPLDQADGLPVFNDRVQAAFNEGRQETYMYVNRELVLVDIKRRVWSYPATKGPQPEPAYISSGPYRCESTSNVLVLIGGSWLRMMIHVLVLSTMTWSSLKPRMIDDAPGRSDFTSSCVNGRIFLLGGRGYHNQFDVYSLREERWLRVKEYSPQLLGNAIEHTLDLQENDCALRGAGLSGISTKHAVAHTQELMVVVGGEAAAMRDFTLLFIAPII